MPYPYLPPSTQLSLSPLQQRASPPLFSLFSAPRAPLYFSSQHHVHPLLSTSAPPLWTPHLGPMPPRTHPPENCNAARLMGKNWGGIENPKLPASTKRSICNVTSLDSSRIYPTALMAAKDGYLPPGFIESNSPVRISCSQSVYYYLQRTTKTIYSEQPSSHSPNPRELHARNKARRYPTPAFKQGACRPQQTGSTVDQVLAGSIDPNPRRSPKMEIFKAFRKSAVRRANKPWGLINYGGPINYRGADKLWGVSDEARNAGF